MISNLRISVAELVVWALLATAGLAWISLRALDGAAWAWDHWRWWPRQGEHRIPPGIDADCWYDTHEDCPGCECACHGAADLLEDLPPERTWEQMTSHQLPLADQRKLTPAQEEAWQPWVAERERRAPKWEAEARGHYVAMGLDYPSGLMARVRELAP